MLIKQPIVRRFLASLTVCIFLATQCLPHGYSAVDSWPQEDPAALSAAQPEISSENFSGIIGPIENYPDEETASEQFLEDSLHLEASEHRELDAEEYDFEDAVAHLSPDYASAVLVKNLSDQNLKRLLDLDFEVGIAIVRGKTVLFTSGDKKEIRVIPPVKSLLEEAELIAHTHPRGEALLPSTLDYQQAGEATEYLISEDGIYAYSRQGLQNTEPFNFSRLTEEIASRYDADMSSKEARDLLNRFIALMDEQNRRDDDTIFRSSSPTVFPGHPVLGFFNGGGAPFLSQWNDQPQSTSYFRFDFNVSGGGYQGAVINFGASPEGPQNLNGFSAFTFQIRSNSRCDALCCGAQCFTSVDVEFKDVNNFAVKKTINVFSSYNYYTFSKSDFPGVNFSAIKEIVFSGSQQPTHPGTGYFDIITGGLEFNPKLEAVSNPSSFPITPIPNNSTGERVTPLPFSNNASFTVNQFSSTFIRLNYSSGSSGYGGIALDYHNGNTPAIETINFNTLFSTGLNLRLDNGGTGINEIVFEMTDINGNKDKVYLQNIQNFGKVWHIKSTHFDKIDLTRIRSFALVIEGNKNGYVNVDWGNFYFEPQVPAVSNPSSYTITPLPKTAANRRVEAVGFASTDGTSTNVDVISSTFVSVRYDGAGANSFGGIFMNYDNPDTGTAETINIESLFPDPNGLVLQLDNGGTSLSEAFLEFTDASNRKGKIRLTGIQNFGKKWVITRAVMDELEANNGINMTQIKTVALVLTGSGFGKRLNVDWGNFLKDPDVLAVPNPDSFAITPLPETSSGGRVTPTGFASSDGSSTTVNQPSATFFTSTYNGAGSASFGGVFMNYDDDNTGAVESINVKSTFPDPNGMVFRLDNGGSSVSEVFLEFTDHLDRKAKVRLQGIQNFGKKWSLNQAIFNELETVFGIDLTRIKVIAFLHKGAGSNQRLNVDWGNFSFVPEAPVTASAVTSFASRQPTLGELEPCSDPTKTPCPGTLNTVKRLLQYSHAQALVDFDLSQGADDNRRFGGALLNFENNPLDTTNGVVLGFKATGTSKLFLDFVDVNDKKVTVAVTNLSASVTRNYSINKALLDLVNVPGFDGTRIKAIAIVINDQATGSPLSVGSFELFTSGLHYEPIAPVTTGPATDVTTLRPSAGELEPCAVIGQDPCQSTLNTVTSFSVPNDDTIALNFNLGNGSDAGFRRFGGALLNFENNNLNADSGFKLGLTATGTSEIKLDFVDVNDRKVTVRVQGLSSTLRYYLFNKSLFELAGVPGFDGTRIKAVAIVVNDQVTAPTAAGSIGILTNGLKVDPVAPQTGSAVTDFRDFGVQPSVGELEPCAVIGQDPCQGTLNTVTSFNQADHTQVAFNYNLGNGSDSGFRRFGGSLINFGDDALNLSSADLILGFKVSGTATINVEFVDGNDNKVTTRVTGLSAAAFQHYRFSAALLNSAGIAGFNVANIKAIAIVVNDNVAGSTTASGTVEMRTAGLAYIPVAQTTIASVTDLASFRPSAGELEPCAVINQTPCQGTLNTITSFSQPDRNTINMNFNLGNGSDTGFRRFGGTLFNFENAPFTLNTHALVLGFKGSGTSQLFVDFVDVNDKKITVRIPAINGSSYTNYLFSPSLLQQSGILGFDYSQVKAVAIVVNDTAAGSKTASGSISIKTANIAFTPVAATTTDPVTDLSFYRPTAGALEPCAVINQTPCQGTLDTVTSFSQPDKDTVNLNFNLGNGSDTGFRRFGGTLLNFENQPLNLNGGAQIVLGFKGSGTSALSVDFVDVNDKKITVRVPAINASSFTRYLFNTQLLTQAGISGFDYSNIKAIAIVVNDVTAGSATASGSLSLQTSNIFFIPVASTTVAAPTDLSASRPGVGELEPCAVINQDPCQGTLNTITAFNQVNSDNFNFTYNLGNGSDTGFRRFGGALLNFENSPFNIQNNPLILGLKSNNSPNLFVDFVDVNDKKITVQVNSMVSGSFRNYLFSKALLESAGITGFDFSQIKAVALVVNDITAGSASATGRIDVLTRGTAYVPVATETTQAVTNLAAQRPPVGELEPCAVINQNPCQATLNTVSSFTQPNKDEVIFNFNLANGSDAGFRRFGGALFNFESSPFNMNNSSLVLGFRSAGTSTLFLDFVDVNNKQITVRVNGLSSASFKKFLFNKSLLEQAGVTGFDFTQITAVSVVVNDIATGSVNATGTVEMQTQNIFFIPSASKISLEPTDLSAYRPTAGPLEPCAVINQDPCSGTLDTVPVFVQSGSGSVRFDYNLANGADTGFRRFGGALLNFETNPFNMESEFMVLGFKSTGTSTMYLDFVDTSDRKITVQVNDLTAGFSNYLFSKGFLLTSGITNFDFSSIKAVAIVVNDQATGSKTATGRIDINTKGLSFVPVATVTTNPVTDLSAHRPTAGALEPCAVINQDPCQGTLDTVPSFNQPSKDQIDLTFNLGNGSDSGFRRFGGSLLNFEQAPFNLDNSSLVLGFKGAGTSQLFVDFVDVNDRKITVNIPSVNGTSFTKYLFNRTLLEQGGISGFDFSQIKAVAVVVNDNATGSSTASGSLSIQTMNIEFKPIATTTASSPTNLAHLQPSAGELEPCSAIGQSPCTSGTLNTITRYEQTSKDFIDLDFNLANGQASGGRRFGGALLTFEDDKLLNLAGSDLVMAFEGAGLNNRIHVDFVDVDGRKITVQVIGILSQAHRGWLFNKALLDSAGVSGFKVDQIKNIAFVISDQTTGSATASGTLNIWTGGMRFFPVADETTIGVTDLSSRRPPVGVLEPCAVIGQDPCQATLNTVPSFNQTSRNEFNFDFNLANGSDDGFRRFGGTLLNFENNPLDLLNNHLVMGFKASGTSEMRMDFVDVNNKKVTVRVTNLSSSAFKKYFFHWTLLEKAGIPGFDFTQIKSIALVMNDQAAGSKTAAGNIAVQTMGLAFDPIAPETSEPLTDLGAKRPAAGELEPCAVIGQSPCQATLNTVTSFNQPTKDAFDFTYNLANGSDTGFRRFGGALLNFENNLLDTTTGLVLGFRASAATSLNLDFVDVNDRKVTVRILNLSGSSIKKFKITKALLDASGIAGFDGTRIKAIAIVINDTVTGSASATGNVEVFTQNIAFTPAAPVTSLAETDLSPYRPNAGELEPCAVIGQDPCQGTLNTVPAFLQTSKDAFQFDYNLSNGSDAGFRRFGGALLNFDGSPLDTTSGLVLGFRATGTNALAVDFVDVNDRKVTVRVLNLNGSSFTKYLFSKTLLDSAGVSGFDATQIKAVAIVVNDGTAGSTAAAGRVEVRTMNIAYVPVATSTASSVTDLGTYRPSAGELEPCAVIGQDPCQGTLNTIPSFSQPTKDQIDLTFNLSNGSDNGFRRFGGSLLNFENAPFNMNTGNLILGFKGTGTSQLFLDFVDANGRKITVKVPAVNGSTFTRYLFNKTLLDQAGVSGFDFSQIEAVAIVVNDTAAGSSTASGSLSIQTSNLPFDPVAEITSDSVTDFSAYELSIGELEPCSIPGLDPCVAGTLNTVPDLTQVSANQLTFDFDLSNGSDIEFRRFGGALLNFSSQTYDTTVPFVVGLSGTGTTGGRMKMDFVDINNRKVTIRIESLGVAASKYKVTKALLESAGIAGFDATRIQAVTLVSDTVTTGSSSASGTIVMDAIGLPFTSTSNGDAYNAALHTVLPDAPGLLAGGGNTFPNRLPGFITQTQSSERDYEFIYDLRHSGTAFVFSQIQWDTAGIALPANVVLGLNGPAGVTVKVEIEDINGNKLTRRLNLQGANRNYTLDLTGDASFDRNHVRHLTLVLDRELVNGNFRDTIQVHTAGLDFIPEIQAAVFDTGRHTALPAQPGLLAAGGNTSSNRLPGFITQTQHSASHYEFIYDLRSSQTAFTFSQIVFPSPQNLPSLLELGLQGPAGSRLKVEVQDIAGNKALYEVLLTGTPGNYVFNLDASHVPAGFDRSQVKFVTLVMDRNSAAGNLRDTIQVYTSGLGYIPVLSGDPYNTASHTLLPNEPRLKAAGANTVAFRVPGFITQTQISQEEYKFLYDLKGSQTAFVFSQLDFTQGLGSLPANVTLGLSGPAGSRVKVEVQDVDGKKAFFYLDLQGSLRNYSLDLTASHVPAGFDRSRVQFITIVMDRELAGPHLRDLITVRTQGIDPSHLISPDGSLSSGDVTVLPGNPQVTVVSPQGGSTLTPLSATQYRIGFNLGQDAQTGIAIQFQPAGQDLSSLDRLVFGIHSSHEGAIRLVLTDVSGRNETFYLSQMDSTQRYYEFLTSLLSSNFDKTKVRRLEMILHPTGITSGGQQGAFEVEIGGTHP